MDDCFVFFNSEWTIPLSIINGKGRKKKCDSLQPRLECTDGKPWGRSPSRWTPCWTGRAARGFSPMSPACGSEERESEWEWESRVQWQEGHPGTRQRRKRLNTHTQNKMATTQARRLTHRTTGDVITEKTIASSVRRLATHLLHRLKVHPTHVNVKEIA